jgi:hypothetical protein
MIVESIGSPIVYLGFTLLVTVLLAVDFVVLNAQGSHRGAIGIKSCNHAARDCSSYASQVLPDLKRQPDGKSRESPTDRLGRSG